jgi:hypothetical protein
MKKQVLKQIKNLQPGDLIRVEWFDASIGKSLSGATIDVPVKSWGIYIGVLGQKQRHIILAQNGFRYSDGLYDVDYTAIPLTWMVAVKVIDREQVTSEEAEKLLTSFLLGKRRTLRRVRQRRVVNHELD